MSCATVAGRWAGGEARKLCIKLPLPIQRALWQPLTMVWGWGPQQLTILMHGAYHHIPWLL